MFFISNGYVLLNVQVMDEIIYRTARGMAAEGAPFRGTLFAGLMIKDGKVGGSALVWWWARAMVGGLRC